MTSERQILVVDDDPDLAWAVREALEDAGYLVAHADDGLSALRHLAAARVPCAILLDLMMPRMDGWTFREALRREPALGRVPVIVMSAHENLERAPIDADAFLKKPMRLDTLLEVVRRVCPLGDGAA